MQTVPFLHSFTETNGRPREAAALLCPFTVSPFRVAHSWWQVNLKWPLRAAETWLRCQRWATCSDQQDVLLARLMVPSSCLHTLWPSIARAHCIGSCYLLSQPKLTTPFCTLRSHHNQRSLLMKIVANMIAGLCRDYCDACVACLCIELLDYNAEILDRAAVPPIPHVVAVAPPRAGAWRGKPTAARCCLHYRASWRFGRLVDQVPGAVRMYVP